MRFLQPLLLSLLIVTVAPAAEKVAPSAGEQSDAPESQRRKASAEWIRRCDKVEGDRRMRCLDEVRAQIVRRFEAQPSDSTNGKRENGKR